MPVLAKDNQTACSCKCTLNSRVIKLFGVKAKWILLLECILLCLVTTLIMNLAFDGMKSQHHMQAASFSLQFILTSWVGLSLWALVYPARHSRASIALACVSSVVLIGPTVLPVACRGSLLASMENNFDAAQVNRIGRIIQDILLSSIFFVWMVMYRGNARSKWVLAAACIIMAAFASLSASEQAWGDLYLIVIAVQIFLFLGVGFFGGHFCWQSPMLIQGPRFEFTSMVAFVFPLLPAGLIIVFLRVYYRQTSMPLRIAIWLGYKVVCFMIVSLWAKMACYAVRHDVQSLLLVFMMVLALQFSTELTFIAIKPFQVEFFLMLAQKTVLHVLLKGGLLLKLHIRIRSYAQRKNFDTTKCGRLLLFITETISDRGPPTLHMGPGDRSLLHFLTDFIYCDMTLLSDIICSIACTTVVGFELTLLQRFPRTFHHGVFTSRIGENVEPWLVFGGYVFVVAWNLASAFGVLWLFLRDSAAITAIGALSETKRKRASIWARRFRYSALKDKSDSQSEDSVLASSIKIFPEAQAIGLDEKKKSSTQPDTGAEFEGDESPNTLLNEFYKAKMKLHVLEKLFLGNLAFHVHFWFCYTVFVVLLYVSWNQAVVHNRKCGVDFYTQSNFTRLHGTPVRLPENDDGCSYYFVNVSEPFPRSEFECVYYASNNSIIYT